MSLIHEVSDIFKYKVYPQRWQTIELNKIVKIQNGYAFKSSKFNSDYRGMPLIRIRDIKNSTSETFYDGEILKEYIVFEEDLLIGMDGDFNSNLWKGIPALLNQRVCRLLPNENIILKKLVYYGLPEFLNKINENTSSTTVKHLSSKSIGDIPFPLPPLTEQNRIVAKLDSLFAQLESIKTSMSKIPVLLKNFRQQVLTQAVTGKLTKEWREGKKISSEQLLCSIQEKRKILINRRDDKNDVFLNNHFLDIPNNWILVNLWDLAFLVTSGSRDWSQYYSEEGAYFVRSAEINNNKLRLKEAIKVNLPEKIEGKRSLIEKGNILITITGANVGKCALIEDYIPESYVSQSVALVKIVNTEISKFIHLSLLSRSDDGSQLENLAYGMGRPVLSLPQIKSVKIPLPSLEEQQEIVSRVESLFAKADAIEEKYKNLKAKIETLPQTILHKAFKGELTEQLETDGDAKVLLEEIAALKNEGKTKNKVIKSTNTIRNKADEN